MSYIGASREDREKNDYYPTPEYVTEALLSREIFIGTIWQPACGEGHISKVLEENGFYVISSDLIDRGYGKVQDFFKPTSNSVTNIITNPPYKLAKKFVEHSKTKATCKIAMFLKLNFLESISRYEMFQDTEFPLARVYVFSKRVTLSKDGTGPSKGGTVAYAWYVWDRQHIGPPEIHWIK